MRVLLDTSGWIELLAGTERGGLFEPALKADRLLVPAIVRYEVGRYLLAHSDESRRALALQALSKFEQIPLDSAIADQAAILGVRHKLAMADSLIYAVACIHKAELWTQDRHFENLPGVRFFEKKTSHSIP
jgi:predicted nucleic acid-binding protein